jgi:hypothetical protein
MTFHLTAEGKAADVDVFRDQVFPSIWRGSQVSPLSALEKIVSLPAATTAAA